MTTQTQLPVSVILRMNTEEELFAVLMALHSLSVEDFELDMHFPEDKAVQMDSIVEQFGNQIMEHYKPILDAYFTRYTGLLPNEDEEDGSETASGTGRDCQPTLQ